MSKKTLFIVIYPFVFTDTVYAQYDLDNFKPYCDIIIWDISKIIDLKYRKSIQVEGSKKKEIVVFQGFIEFIHQVRLLGTKSPYTNICILNQINNNSLNELICNLIIRPLLKNKNITIFDMYNGGIPLQSFNNTFKQNEIKLRTQLLERLVRFFSTINSIHHFRNRLSGLSIRLLERLIPKPVSFHFVAGEDWLNFALKRSKHISEKMIVLGNSIDYNNYLINKSLKANIENKAILLDRPAPAFNSDYVLLKLIERTTSEVWYPKLSIFFNQIENETDVIVDIAGHYKSAHPHISPLFGNREVHYGRTREMVQNCKFVITISSTAISYAVIYRKPIILIFSDQLKLDKVKMMEIKFLANLLGITPINIDKPPSDIKNFLTVDEAKYINYEKSCLISDHSMRPNFQIILEEIMNIQYNEHSI